MGALIFFANVEHGAIAGMIAGVKQALYSFTVAVVLVSAIQRLTRVISRANLPAIPITVILFWLVAIALSSVVHLLVPGTANGYTSVILSASLSPIGTFIIARDTVRTDRRLGNS